MVVIVRLDLNQYHISQLEAFVMDGVITAQEATESKAYKAMSEYDQLMWFRKWNKLYKAAVHG